MFSWRFHPTGFDNSNYRSFTKRKGIMMWDLPNQFSRNSRVNFGKNLEIFACAICYQSKDLRPRRLNRLCAWELLIYTACEVACLPSPFNFRRRKIYKQWNTSTHSFESLNIQRMLGCFVFLKFIVQKWSGTAHESRSTWLNLLIELCLIEATRSIYRQEIKRPVIHIVITFQSHQTREQWIIQQASCFIKIIIFSFYFPTQERNFFSELGQRKQASSDILSSQPEYQLMLKHFRMTVNKT